MGDINRKKVKDIIKKYNLPIYGRYNISTMQSTTRHVDIKKIMTITSKAHNEHGVFKTYKPLNHQDHVQFTKDLLEKTDYKEPKLKLKYPIIVKSTQSSHSKRREKYEAPKFKLLPQPKIKELNDSISLDNLMSPFYSIDDLTNDNYHQINIVEPKRNDMILVDQSKAFLLDLLTIPITDRSESQIMQLYNYFRVLHPFVKMSDPILRHVCTLGSLVVVKEEDTVCQFGSMNDTWYVVLEGKVQVRKLKPTIDTINFTRNNNAYLSKQTIINISDLHSNIGFDQEFGTLIRVFDSPSLKYHAAIPLQHSLLFRFELVDYSKICQVVHNSTMEGYIKKLDLFDICKDISYEKKSLVAELTSLQFYSKDDIIVNQYEPIHKMGLICKGLCEAFHELDDGNHVSLGILKPGDYFGEHLCDQSYSLKVSSTDYHNRRFRSTSFFTIKAMEDTEVVRTYIDDYYIDFRSWS
ncbi:hypothetical protein BC833DRAFT_239122 [Globomyces pollinis-pini]|nr:hypothetical protein BC833DRAFT_239122 [Globomyces pollinis-pini]